MPGLLTFPTTKPRKSDTRWIAKQKWLQALNSGVVDGGLDQTLVFDDTEVRHHDTKLITLQKILQDQQSAVGSGGSGSDLLTGLVSYWPLETADGNCEDLVGVNDLTNNAVTSVAGKINNGAAFEDINSSYLWAADHASLDFTTAFSFSDWIYGNPLNANACIAAKWNYSTDGCWSIQLNGAGSGIIVFIADAPTDPGDNSVTFNAAGLTSSAFHHIVVTYNAGVVKLYVNGSEISSSSTAGVIPVALQNSAAQFRLGTFQGLGRFWQGRQDEVGLWSRALTAAEVTTLHGGGAGLAYPFE